MAGTSGVILLGGFLTSTLTFMGWVAVSLGVICAYVALLTDLRDSGHQASRVHLGFFKAVGCVPLRGLRVAFGGGVPAGDFWCMPPGQFGVDAAKR